MTKNRYNEANERLTVPKVDKAFVKALRRDIREASAEFRHATRNLEVLSDEQRRARVR